MSHLFLWLLQIVFGSHTDANILNNLSPENISPLLGAPVASVLCFAIRAGYCVSLISTFGERSRVSGCCLKTSSAHRMEPKGGKGAESNPAYVL